MHYVFFPKKKSSLRALRAHNVRTYNSGASCAGSAPPAGMQAYYIRVSSLPKGLIVSDFLMHTPLLAIEQSSKHDNMH